MRDATNRPLTTPCGRRIVGARAPVAAIASVMADDTREPRMSSRLTILTVSLVLVAAAGMWLWRLAGAEPMASFRDFPWTYISEAKMGSDESAVVITRGSINGPPSVSDAAGATAWPAYVHPDPHVVPLIDGKPCIIPLISDGNTTRTPVIRSLKRPLTHQEMNGLVRYVTPEGRERMDAFRKEMGQ